MDASVLLQHCAQMLNLEGTKLDICDANGDGITNVYDISFMLIQLAQGNKLPAFSIKAN